MTTGNPARLAAAQAMVTHFRAIGHPATIGRPPRRPTAQEMTNYQRSPAGWSISRDALAQQLLARLAGPQEPSQVSTNYCGPAAFLYCLLEDRPDLYAAYAIALWRYGHCALGSVDPLQIESNATTVGSMRVIQQQRAAAPRQDWISELDWMTMSMLSVSTRPGFVFGGGASPGDEFKAITYPGVVRGWFKSVGSTPAYDCMGQGILKQDLGSFADLMKYWPRCWIVLQIDSSMITGGNTSTFHNRHWVVVNPHRLAHATPPGGAPVLLGQLRGQFRRIPGVRGTSRLDWSHMNNWRTDLTLVTWGDEAHTIRAATLGEIEDRFYGGIAFPRIR